MKFARLGPPGREIPVVLNGTTAHDLRPITADIDGAFLASTSLRDIVLSQLPKIENADALRIGAPVARPSAIYCVGMNYAAHAAESGAKAPEQPVLFMKPPNTLSGPFDDAQIPRNSVKTDWEVELAVVIGRRCNYLDSPKEAMDYVAGFTLANDLSERAFQIELSGGQWSKGKSAPGFTPLGPWLVTPDEIDHHNLRLRSYVNGQPRQDSVTSDMIFSVEHVIWHLSQFLAFEPGDIILTGTPEGVALSGKFPYLSPGDVVELEIEGLGSQRQVMQAHTGGH